MAGRRRKETGPQPLFGDNQATKEVNAYSTVAGRVANRRRPMSEKVGIIIKDAGKSDSQTAPVGEPAEPATYHDGDHDTDDRVRGDSAPQTRNVPSVLFGGLDGCYVPNLVIPPATPPATTHTLPDLGYHATNAPPNTLRRTLYVSRNLHSVTVLTVVWDTPDAIYVQGGHFPPGWHECRVATLAVMVTAENAIHRLQAAVAAGEADAWQAEPTLARWRDLLAAYQSLH